MSATKITSESSCAFRQRFLRKGGISDGGFPHLCPQLWGSRVRVWPYFGVKRLFWAKPGRDGAQVLPLRRWGGSECQQHPLLKLQIVPPPPNPVPTSQCSGSLPGLALRPLHPCKGSPLLAQPPGCVCFRKTTTTTTTRRRRRRRRSGASPRLWPWALRWLPCHGSYF